MSASRFGPVLKVSEDGGIAFFERAEGVGDLKGRVINARCTMPR